jgi:hypothetical protein
MSGQFGSNRRRQRLCASARPEPGGEDLGALMPPGEHSCAMRVKWRPAFVNCVAARDLTEARLATRRHDASEAACTSQALGAPC